jgi:hypothetical protein
MSQNPFDKASRFAAKIEPATFLAWATGLPADRFTFREWLDTRAIPLPHEPDQIGDSVARVANANAAEPDWAVAIEFQIEPDPLMFGRLMVYLGHLWQSVKPDPERGSRFNVAAIVFNLTATGSASRDMRWPDAGFVTQLGVVERNLAGENADDLLVGVESGRWSRAVLPWLPLMTGGDDAGIIDRWKALADGEPDFRRKGNYASLALVFAGAAKRKDIWKKALEGWNVIESEVVNEWIAEGEARGKVKGKAEGRVEEAVALAIAVCEAKFGTLPAEVEAKIRGTSDLTTLHTWVTQAAKAATIDEFRAAAGL